MRKVISVCVLFSWVWTVGVESWAVIIRKMLRLVFFNTFGFSETINTTVQHLATISTTPPESSN